MNILAFCGLWPVSRLLVCAPLDIPAQFAVVLPHVRTNKLLHSCESSKDCSVRVAIGIEGVAGERAKQIWAGPEVGSLFSPACSCPEKAQGSSV